jgi:hypothetical protein
MRGSSKRGVPEPSKRFRTRNHRPFDLLRAHTPNDIFCTRS